MNRRIASLSARLSVFLLTLASTPGVARAIDIPALDGTPSSAGEIIKNITHTLLVVAGVISVIMIIVGGIMYSLSAGDSKKAGTAKDTILYSVVGLVITLLAGAIVSFVIGRF